MIFSKLQKTNVLISFKLLKDKIEKSIKKEILQMGEKNILRDAVEYSLLNGGKRYRPILVLLIAEIVNKKFDVTCAAMCVEFLHTASIIADDLPSMDDERFRRNKKSLHLKFNEANAILASYSLISLAYEMIIKNGKILEKSMPKERVNGICILAIETISKFAGINGATLGQHLDLFSKDLTLDNINKIIHLKTISLFEISFILGWIFAGGDFDKIEIVKKCAYNFGMAFQIADDLEDYEEDLNKGKKINIAIALGKDTANKNLNKAIEDFKEGLKKLNLYTEPFRYLIKKIKDI
ncbi:MAG: Farnesyl diphosphate synthase [Candidatus Anoxychlamydiales bacterium]|nr:Farnesyl diphosphate synthase [Candidatus Anoxychlamydiales bacterium]